MIVTTKDATRSMLLLVQRSGYTPRTAHALREGANRASSCSMRGSQRGTRTRTTWAPKRGTRTFIGPPWGSASIRRPPRSSRARTRITSRSASRGRRSISSGASASARQQPDRAAISTLGDLSRGSFSFSLALVIPGAKVLDMTNTTKGPRAKLLPITTWAAEYLVTDVFEGMLDLRDLEIAEQFVAQFFLETKAGPRIAVPSSSADREMLARILTDYANACDDIRERHFTKDDTDVQGMTRAQWSAARDGLGTLARKVRRAA